MCSHRLPVRRGLASVILAALMAACGGSSPPPPDASFTDSGVRDTSPRDSGPPDSGTALDSGAPAWDDISALVETTRRDQGLIALVGGAVSSDGLLAMGAAGLRKRGGSEPVDLFDRWHLGSDTKAMTATLAAILVEDGEISWDTTVESAFPSFASRLDPAYRDVTLVHLLTHRSGLTGSLPADDPDAWAQLWANDGPLPEQRLWLADRLLTRVPSVAPGSAYLYSNAGYIIAGAMLEVATGRSWEELMGDRLFMPLGMRSCGFGAPGSATLVDEPWGHGGASLDPVPPGPGADNPPALGPAGTVHCALDDWASFIALHLRGGSADTALLPAAAFARLHADPGFGTPTGFGYGYGWALVSRPWAGGTALQHVGSNTMWYAIAWLAPGEDRAYIAITNQADAAAEPGTDALIAALLGRYPAE